MEGVFRELRREQVCSWKPFLAELARIGWVPSPSRGRPGTLGRGISRRRFEHRDRQVGAAAAGVGFSGGKSMGGGARTHRVQRRGCPRAHGLRVAWRRRVAGKVPGSGGRPAPRPAGPPCCALRPGGASASHRGSAARRARARRARPGAAAALSRWPRPGPGCRQRAHAQPAASDCGTLRLRGRPLRAAAHQPSPSLPALSRRRRRDPQLDLSSKFCPGSDF